MAAGTDTCGSSERVQVNQSVLAAELQACNAAVPIVFVRHYSSAFAWLAVILRTIASSTDQPSKWQTSV